MTLAKLLGVLVVAGVLGAGVLLPYVGGVGVLASDQSSKFLNRTCDLVETSPPQKTTIYASDGTTALAEIFKQDRTPVTYQQIPSFLIKALVDTEDRRFYSHHGVDMRGLLRSALNTGSGNTQGGSTLTMQYVKQVRYYQAIVAGDQAAANAAIDQNIDRKIEDAKCALQLEKHNSKAEILTKYLNIAFFGENSYGIGTAAKTYFNKSVNQLTLPEAALLVGIVRAPSSYDPFQDRKAATARRNEVIQNLVTAGALSQAQATKYEAEPVVTSTTSPPNVQEGCANSLPSVQNSGFFCDYVLSWLASTQGLQEGTLQTGGYKIRTTLSPTLQNSLQSHIQASLPASSAMTAIMPTIDPSTGGVLAMATSKLYGNPTSSKDTTHTTLPIFNLAVAGAASTYKYFTMLAMLKAGIPASTWQLQGGATQYTTTSCPTPFTAQNDDSPARNFSTDETLTSALAKSSNTFFLAAEDQLWGCNLTPIVSSALSVGMNALKQPTSAGSKLTIAQAIEDNGSSSFTLGNDETSPLELTGAYATAANDGTFCPPRPVVSITTSTGAPVALKNVGCSQQLTPQVARTAVQALTGDTTSSNGTSYSVFQPFYQSAASKIVASKTGTRAAAPPNATQNSGLWFVGMTPQYVSTTAIINLSSPSSPITSLPGLTDPGTQAYGAYAGQVWLNAMQSTLQAEPAWSWPSPDAVSGAVPVPNVTNQTVAAATATLQAAGFKVQNFADIYGGAQCASPINAQVTFGNVAFQSPANLQAQPGSTITICPASGTTTQVYVPPVVRQSPNPPAGTTRSGGTTPTGGAGTPTAGTSPSAGAPASTTRPSPPNGTPTR